MHRFMIFVDGSNQQGDLSRMSLRVDDYERFYGYILERSLQTWRSCCIGKMDVPVQLVRVLWYCVGALDRWDLDDPKAQATLREVFERERELKSHYMMAAGREMPNRSQHDVALEAWRKCFNELREWYDERVAKVEGYRRFYHAIRSSTDFIDVIECAHWKVDLFSRRVAEKGLDTRLAVDMVALIDCYDIALLLSGDADNIPSIDHVKARGNQVGVIEFLGGYPPEKKSAQTSSRLKLRADFVVPIYEMDLVRESIAYKNVG